MSAFSFILQLTFCRYYVNFLFRLLIYSTRNLPSTTTQNPTSEQTKQKKPRKEKVAWDDSERQALIDAAAIISLDDTDHLWNHLAKAQDEVLPPNRHRRIQGKHIVTSEILALFQKARGELLSRKERVEVKVEVPVSIPVDRVAFIATITNAEFFELLVQRLSPLIAGIKGFAEILAGIAKTHAPHLEPRNPEATTSSPPTKAPDESRPPAVVTPVTPVVKPTSKTKKTKVLLFGFSMIEEAEILRKAASFNNIELFFAFQSPGGPFPSIPVCDWCIVNRKPPLTRRAKEALANRPGTAYTIDAGTSETALQRLNDINSKQN